MDGPTSDDIDAARMDHTVRLVEVHTITITMPTLPDHFDAAVTLARDYAVAWSAEQDLDVIPTVFVNAVSHGVFFEVEVGRGVLAIDDDTEAVDRWTWSGRVFDVAQLIGKVVRTGVMRSSAPVRKIPVDQGYGFGQVIPIAREFTEADVATLTTDDMGLSVDPLTDKPCELKTMGLRHTHSDGHWCPGE